MRESAHSGFGPVPGLGATGLGIAFWGDRPGPKLWIGGAMTLAGILLIALRSQAKSRPAPVAEEL